ncbi:MAG: carboxymuconolactone decarboxylase family protein [Myxococcales bacterium]|nr:carboxymuconolactone decarboxylase family protein [Myxococcales bacterium]
MAHLEPRPARGAGLLVRLAYRAARRRLGRVPTPVAIMAHHRAILAATGGFELAFERAHAVEDRLKHLVMVKVASLVGCRFCIDIGEALAVDRGVTEERALETVLEWLSPARKEELAVEAMELYLWDRAGSDN